MSDERDWTDLSPDLIRFISKKLPDLPDFIRFRAVCKNWCSSTPLSDPPPQLPWLLESLPQSLLQKELRYYSLSTGETRTIHVEESRWGKAYRGPCCGYLLIHGAWNTPSHSPQNWKPEENCVVLFNPLTNVNISLPSIGPHCISAIWPIWTGSDLDLSRNIVFVDSSGKMLDCWAVYHPDKTKWVLKQGFFYNSCYWDGMFFTTTRRDDTQVFDGTSRKLLYYIPSPDEWGDRGTSYLVELSGAIMRVSLKFHWSQNVEKSNFRIYKLHFEGRNEQPCWVEVSNIGNHMLFLDEKNGFSLKPTLGFRGNCIYFFHHKDGTPFREMASGEKKYSLLVSKEHSELLTILVKPTWFSTNPDAEFDLNAHLTVQMPFQLGEVKLHLAQKGDHGDPPSWCSPS